VKANGEAIDDARDLSRTVAGLKPGTKVPFEIVRDGKRQTIEVEVGTMPGEAPKMANASKDTSKVELADLGIEVEKAEDGEGVRITKLDPKSAAAERGLKPGDVILEVAGDEVSSAGDVANALKDAKGKKVLMLVRSGDRQTYITLPRDQG
jgi:serine protease Do